MDEFYILALAVLIDRLFGEPPDKFHSTVWIGKLCETMQKRLSNSPLHGVFMFFSVTLIPSTIALFLLLISKEHSLSVLFGALMLKLQFSWKGLSDYTLPVLDALDQGIERARAQLIYLVGRDTHDLDEESIISATVESTAEATNDGIIAALFYYVIFGTLFGATAGVTAAVFFRAVSTLDSMVGYKKDGFEKIGFLSARADDLLNFIPSRVTAIFILFSALILRENFKNALKVFKRDRNKTISPNAGQPMAAMAGALGVKLEKTCHHILGDPLRKLQRTDIKRAIRLSNLATVLFLFTISVIIL